MGNELSWSSALHDAIVSGRLEWGRVLHTANAQFLSPTLWAALQQRGLAAYLPADIQDYLAKIHELNLVRNEHLRKQALEAVRALNDVGVKPLLLKGTAHLFLDTYDDPGSRVMQDLDILVPKDKAIACWDRLLCQGYSPIKSGRDFSSHHHLEPLRRAGEYGTIEIHTDALGPEANRILATDWIWQNSQPIDADAFAATAPAPTFMLLHNIVHAAVEHCGYEVASGWLRSLHELALTATVHRGSVDWKLIRSTFHREDRTEVFDAWIYLSHRLFGYQPPEDLRFPPATVMYSVRYRMQARWSWVDALARRLLLFSAHNIRERYQWHDRFAAVWVGRLRLVTEVACDYGARAVRWTWRRLSRSVL